MALGLSVLQFPQQFTKHFHSSYIIWSSKAPREADKPGLGFVFFDFFFVFNPHLGHERN